MITAVCSTIDIFDCFLKNSLNTEKKNHACFPLLCFQASSVGPKAPGKGNVISNFFGKAAMSKHVLRFL